MGFHAAQCPSCLKNIQVPDDAKVSLCMYCGEKISIAQVSPTTGPSVVNLLGMARTASTAGNQAEAEIYFNRVLEIDPTISEAWIGKGKAAGWLSTIGHIRFSEMLVAFGHAIATAPDAQKEAQSRECLHEVNLLVVTVYGMARKHLIEFVALPNIWADYLAQVAEMLTTLEQALAWDPLDKITLENIVHLCKDNIEGINYRDQFDKNLPKVWFLSPDYERLIRQKLEFAAGALKALDPAYVAPVAQAKKADACFVVTATMGDEHHPTVMIMREFRDQWLVEKPGGKPFIAWYYVYGPLAANVIRDSPVLRKLCYAMVIWPAAWVARRIMKHQRSDG
jgi:hypothetical protein